MIDPKEFTDPFCIERFRAGEPALFVFESALRFHKDGHAVNRKGDVMWPKFEEDLRSVKSEYRMRPKAAQADADGWIKCFGVCPDIAKDWKAGEYEIKEQKGDIYKSIFGVLSHINGGSFATHIVAIRRLPSANVEPINTSSEHVEEVEENRHVKSCIDIDEYIASLPIEDQKLIEKFRRGMFRRKPYKPFLNETWEIAGRYLNGVVERRLVEVDRDVALALVKR